MSSNQKVRVAIIGVGNCASALIQGVEYYRDAEPDIEIPGLMHATVGGYHVSDIEFSAAFDVTAAKVGLDLSKAIDAEPNNTIQICRGASPQRPGDAGADPRRIGSIRQSEGR